MKVDYCYLGVKDKLSVVKTLCESLSITLSKVAYIGDDLNDMAVLSKVGFAGVPASAPEYVKKLANVPLSNRGGEGVFREFIEVLIGEEQLSEIINNVYLIEQ